MISLDVNVTGQASNLERGELRHERQEESKADKDHSNQDKKLANLRHVFEPVGQIALRAPCSIYCSTSSNALKK